MPLLKQRGNVESWKCLLEKIAVDTKEIKDNKQPIDNTSKH